MVDQHHNRFVKIPPSCYLPPGQEKVYQRSIGVYSSALVVQQPSKEVFPSEKYWLERCINLERKIVELEQAVEESKMKAYKDGYNAGVKEVELKVAEDVRRANEGLIRLFGRASDTRQGSGDWDEICKRAF